MMRLLLALGLGACAEPGLAFHLAVTPPGEDPWLTMRPSFTSCEGCQEVHYDLAGVQRRWRIAPEPVLVVGAGSLAGARIRVEAPPLDPGRRFFTLLGTPREELAGEVARVMAKHMYERFVALQCNGVMSAGWVGFTWETDLPLGIFDHREGADVLAKQLGVEPELIPFDARRDEGMRVSFLKIELGGYLGDPSGRERLQRERPDLYRFLESHPKYWGLLEDPSGLRDDPR